MTFIFLATLLTYSQTSGTDNWQVIKPVTEEFSAKMPASMLDYFYDNRDKYENSSRRYVAKADGNYYYIFSDPVSKPTQYQEVLNFTQSFISGEVFPAGDYQSKAINYTDGIGFHYSILAVKTPNRVYIFQSVSPHANDLSVKAFFSGIEFNRKIANITDKTSTKGKGKPPLIPTVSMKEVAGRSSGRGSGAGAGSGNGSGMPSSTPTQAQPGQISPLKILSSKRPNFTEFARFYEVEGKTMIRVTFLASGEIGDVVPVSPLPFGLTEQAMSAARNIKFTPAMDNGKPYDVTKTMEYSFTTY